MLRGPDKVIQNKSMEQKYAIQNRQKKIIIFIAQHNNRTIALRSQNNINLFPKFSMAAMN